MRIDESLANLVKNEPKTKAARQAKKLGLRYMGFGRYAGRDGKISYVVSNKTGDLIPYKSAEDHQKMYNAYNETDYDLQRAYSNKDEKTIQKLTPKADELKAKLKDIEKERTTRKREDEKTAFFKFKEQQNIHKALKDFYKTGMFDKNELEALAKYTAVFYSDMNKYLYGGHEPGEHGKDLISFLHKTMVDLDRAFEDIEAPFNFPTYSGLGPDVPLENLKAGQKYLFRGYMSTSIDHKIPLDIFAWQHNPKKKGDKEHQILLQIDIEKGDKGIYIDGLGALDGGEKEFLLPRGTMIEIISGPHKIENSVLSKYSWDEDGPDVMLFHCRIVKEKE